MRVGLVSNLPGLDSVRQQGVQDAALDRVFSAIGGNSGNIAYVAGTRRVLMDEVIAIDWSTANEFILNNCDIVVIACANQLGPHADLNDWANKLERLRLPVVLIGLGAQAAERGVHVALPEGTVRFLRLVRELRPEGSETNIAVRGDFSRSVLETYGGSGVSLGCPSLFLNLDPALGAKVSGTARSKAGSSFTLAAGNPFLSTSVGAEVRLCELAYERQGRCVVQHPFEMVALASGKEPGLPEHTIEFIRQRMLPRLTNEKFLAWVRSFWDLHLDVHEWMIALKEYHRVIGARYHGVALGVQAGLPSCVVAIDARTQELAETSCIPVISVSEAAAITDVTLIDDLWSGDWGQKFDDNRARLARGTVSFLQAQGLTPCHELQALARN
ncbi:polysaccharide pyruvyl transferase family protein [Methylobacterium nigriterrae]|uniref:polysaccharide pyruvyl transferase family protein n=1 Tax=Methylobacterium nigriterrae TaxID=3127512 RepID=UPI003013723C